MCEVHKFVNRLRQEMSLIFNTFVVFTPYITASVYGVSNFNEVSEIEYRLNIITTLTSIYLEN